MQPIPKPKELLDLPQELRLMIIDEMDSKTKCIFSGCSKICRNDVRMSKKWTNQIRFLNFGNKITIEVYHDLQNSHLPQNGSEFSYQLVFEKTNRTKHIKCCRPNGLPVWEHKLENGLELSAYATTTFREMLTKFEKSLREIVMFSWNFDSLQSHFENLTNLKKLSLHSCNNLAHFLTNFRQPLRTLAIDSDVHSQYLLQFQQIFKVKDYLDLEKITLDIDSLKNLAAGTVSMPIGSLSESDLSMMVKEWQDGTWNINQAKFVFVLSNSTFDVPKLLELLGRQNEQDESGFFGIKNHLDPRKKSLFYFDTSKVVFYVYT